MTDTDTKDDPIADAAADAAMAVFDRSLRLMAPPRHVVAEALDAAAGVYAAADEQAVEDLVARAQLAGLNIENGDVAIRFKQAHEVLQGVVAAFDGLFTAHPGASNYLEMDKAVTEPRWVEQETTFTDPAREQAITAGLPPQEWPPHRRYHVIVVKPDGKSPHTLRQEAEARAARAEAQLAAVRAAGVDPSLLRWCGWPGCWRSYNAVTGPVERGWQRTNLAMVTLCPFHDQLGHRPAFDWDRDNSTLHGLCDCGERVKMDRTNQDAVMGWWTHHVQGIAPDDTLPDGALLAERLTVAEARIAAALALVAGGMPAGPRNLRAALTDVECSCGVWDGEPDLDLECPIHGDAHVLPAVMVELLGPAREATMWAMGSWVREIEQAAGERTHYDGLLANVVRAVLDRLDEAPLLGAEPDAS
jgi:hypothetical protein